MRAKPLLQQQVITAKGDAPSRDLVEIVQRIVEDIMSLDGIEAANAANAPGSAPRFFARAWVNFNGTGTVAIRASGNVASITDNGVGDYTINFTTPMPDANYAVAVSTGSNASAQVAFVADDATPRSTTAVRIRVANTAFALTDSAHVSVVIFR